MLHIIIEASLHGSSYLFVICIVAMDRCNQSKPPR
jgi:hypothetical protein